MKLLLHICCAPCLIYPYRVLKDQGMQFQGIYYNPNIHPYSEYEKRRSTLQQYASDLNFHVFFPDDYPMEDFLRGTVFREGERCIFCYHQRLKHVAIFAKQNGFTAFSTTLLYSKYQRHEIIREIGINLAKEYGIRFHYEDFRTGWKEGVEISKKTGLYRQQYCGCIYSEKDRFFGSSKK